MKRALNIFLTAGGIMFWLFIAIWLFNRVSGQTYDLRLMPEKKATTHYRITWGKVGLWSGMGVAGAMWGARETYRADPSVFERRWGVDEYSFFGSKAWERNYQGNRYRNADGGTNPHKPEWGNTYRDYWHFSGFYSRAITVGAAFTIGAGKQKLKYKLLDMLIGSAVSSTSGWATYKYLRR
jgi:hypothetical protein